MADLLKVHPKTVIRYTMELCEHPSLMFRCPVLRRGKRYNKSMWECGFCGEEMTGSERKAREHVAEHVLPTEVIIMQGVMDKDWSG